MSQDELDKFLISAFPGEPDAARFLCDVSRMVRLVDDVADGDAPEPAAALAQVMEFALVRLPTNPFYARWYAALAPMLVTIHAVWSETDDAKSHPIPQRRMWGYIWRDGIELMLYHVAVLVGGVDHARIVLKTFLELDRGESCESFEEWESS